MPNTCKFGKTPQEQFQSATTQFHDGCKIAGNHRATYQSASDYYIQVCTDYDGVITSINRYGAAFFGKAENEIVGQNVFELVVPMESAINGTKKQFIKCFMSSPDTCEFAEFETNSDQGK